MVVIIGLSRSVQERINGFITSVEPSNTGDVNVVLYEDVQVKYSFGDVVLSNSSEIQTISQYDFDKIVMN